MTEELRARLPEQALDLLDSNDGRYSEWATASALAMHCMNVEFTEDEFVEVVSVSDFAYYFATENGRDRSDRLERRLRKVWDRAEEHWEPPLGSKADVRRKLTRVARAVESVPWPGRSGVTDRTVALTLIDYAHNNGAWTINMSARLLGELAGVRKDTASVSLRRLAKTGLVRRQEVETVEPWSAGCWALNLE